MDNGKNQYGGSNTNGQSANIDQTEFPVSDQVAECGFTVISEHEQVLEY